MLELWAGVEATVNRVGDRFFDQMQRSGHDQRINDVDALAALGIRTVRYPFLWEHVHAHSWGWAEARLARMQALRLEPIAGLLHHGSGPPTTHLLDPKFPKLFAAYAGAFAERFPWVKMYTPINEPLTTARFSALYGFWYPHARNEGDFLRALLHQIQATVLAMKAIRRVQPHAQLVQTEDMGITTSSLELSYQADYQNLLRWLSFDLLTGRVTPEHPLHERMQAFGIPRDALNALSNEPCPPDVYGINHYVTSDRFLDVDLSRHPPRVHGGNGRHRYADVEAVTQAPSRGHRAVLTEVWERYAAPLAITEVHIDAGREDQLRWAHQAWTDSLQARAGGVNVRAVTMWAAFGAFDWNCLVTQERGHYEPGLFDVRAPTPRPTRLAKMAASLAGGGDFTHPVLAASGWWKRRHGIVPTHSARPVLIVGGSGTLGRALTRVCALRGIEVELVARTDVDITALSSVEPYLDERKPWALINAAGYVRVDAAESDPDACFLLNTHAAVVLAVACATRGIPYVTFSSDLVFDGGQSIPYVEGDATAPLSVYGKSKAAAEQQVLSEHPRALVIRTSAFFGPWDETNFVASVMRGLSARRPVRVCCEQTVSPTYVPALAHTCLDLLIDDEGGLWHLANVGQVTWEELALLIAETARLDPSLVEGRTAEELGWAARRPRYSVLGMQRPLMPALEASLRACLGECGPMWGRG